MMPKEFSFTVVENEKLEEKWEELKALGDKYRELEKDILEKEQIWNTLKK